MLRKNVPQKETIQKEWPENYYESFHAKERLQLLSKALNTEKNDNDLFRMKIFQTRYSEKKGQFLDLYMQSWIYMKLNAENGLSFFNKKKHEKEWLKYSHIFQLDLYPELSARQKELLELEWQSFFTFYFESCLTDRTYSSTLLGMFPMKEDRISQKMLAELDLLTKDYPAQLGMEHTFLPLRNAAFAIYNASYAVVTDAE